MRHRALGHTTPVYQTGLTFELGAQGVDLGARIEHPESDRLALDGPAGRVELDLFELNEPELRARWLGYLEQTRALVQVRVPLTGAMARAVADAVLFAEREGVHLAHAAVVGTTVAWAHPHVWDHVSQSLDWDAEDAPPQTADMLGRCRVRISRALARFAARSNSP